MVSWIQRLFSRHRRKETQLSVIREPEGSFVGPSKFRRSERVFFANQNSLDTQATCHHIDPKTYDTLKGLTKNLELPDEVRDCLSGFLASNVRKDLKRIPKTPYASQRVVSSLSSTPEKPELDGTSLERNIPLLISDNTVTTSAISPIKSLTGSPISDLVNSSMYAIYPLERITAFVPGARLHTTVYAPNAAKVSLPNSETSEYRRKPKGASPPVCLGRSSSLTKPRFQAEIYGWLKKNRRLSTFSESSCFHSFDETEPIRTQRSLVSLTTDTILEESPGSEIYEISDLPYFDGKLQISWPDSDASSIITAPSLSHTMPNSPSSTSSDSNHVAAIIHADSVEVQAIENNIGTCPQKTHSVSSSTNLTDKVNCCMTIDSVNSPLHLLKMDIYNNLLINADLIDFSDEASI